MSTSTATANASLVASFIETAQGFNASEWEFMAEALKYSLTTRQASVKQAQKESGLSLPNITPNSVQFLDTLAVIVDRFPETAETLSFKQAFSLARKWDKGAGSAQARKAIKQAETLEQAIETAPKRKGAGARPASETFEGTVSEATDMRAFIYDYAQGLDETARIAFAKELLDLAKLIKAMDKVNA